MRRIVVTGASGFLGQATCLGLKQDFKLIGLGRNQSKGKLLESQGIEFQAVDLADLGALTQAFAHADAVVHCAARSSPWGQWADFHRDNVIGTQNVIDACLAQGVQRLIHISSPSIYFELQDRWGIKESDPLPSRWLNHYAASKWAAEERVQAAIKNQALTAIILRPQAIFGPEDPAILPRLIEVNQTTGIPVFKGRSPWIDITYVENVAHAIALALDARREACNQAYNITNGEPLELLPFLEKVFVRLGLSLRKKHLPYALAAHLARGLESFHQTFLPDREPRLTPYKLGVLSHSRTLDISRARQMLGYQPLWTVDQGVDAFVSWWRTQPT